LFKLFSDIWFIVDIGLNFCTGIPMDGIDSASIEFNPNAIKKRYVCGNIATEKSSFFW